MNVQRYSSNLPTPSMSPAQILAGPSCDQFLRPSQQEISYESLSKAGSHGPSDVQQQSGFLNGASQVVVHDSMMIEHCGNIVNNITMEKTVRERLAPYTNLDAAADSHVRSPPPRCRQGTRVQILTRLMRWLTDPERQSNVIWLRGFVGTGKSAVAQTFAESCFEKGRLSASFFFSQSKGHNSPDHIIPTLVYQLAGFIPKYQTLLFDQLFGDPEWMRKTRRTQFKRLIIEPFLLLQIQEPIAIILDGLDECNGNDAQHEIIEMVNEAAQLGKALPFLWLICSRSEAHLTDTFRTIDCAREELSIDMGSRNDVELYLRGGLARIKEEFSITTAWPPEKDVIGFLRGASGLFAFASAGLNYIGDSDHGDPMARLSAFLSFLKKKSKAGSNPLKTLDLLYTRVFDGISDEVVPITKQILSFPIYMSGPPLPAFAKISAQALCNFLRLEQTTFYGALRKLFSVVVIPSPEAASKGTLRFYHTSFRDFLQDALRSGKFFIDGPNAIVDYTKLCLSWYESDMSLFHSSGGSDLKWVSDDNKEEISLEIANLANKWDEGLLSQIWAFDFRKIQISKVDHRWCDFVNWLWKSDPSSGIVRTEPHTNVDHQLLEYMRTMSQDCEPIEPAEFPLKFAADSHARGYFLIGNDRKAIICLFSAFRKRFRVEVLSSDKKPSEKRIQAYRKRMLKVGWYQEVVTMKNNRVTEDMSN